MRGRYGSESERGGRQCEARRKGGGQGGDEVVSRGAARTVLPIDGRPAFLATPSADSHELLGSRLLCARIVRRPLRTSSSVYARSGPALRATTGCASSSSVPLTSLSSSVVIAAGSCCAAGNASAGNAGGLPRYLPSSRRHNVLPHRHTMVHSLWQIAIVWQKKPHCGPHYGFHSHTMDSHFHSMGHSMKIDPIVWVIVCK